MSWRTTMTIMITTSTPITVHNQGGIAVTS
jgi:hypothetical protein